MQNARETGRTCVLDAWISIVIGKQTKTNNDTMFGINMCIWYSLLV